MKTVIVGGVAGGMSTATRLRRLDEQAEIVVLERGPHVSYANCGLPYHLGGVIADREALLLQTPESLAARFGLDVRTGHEVLSVDTAARTVLVLDLADSRTYTEPYDHLVLSPGARPVVPPVPGAERALTLRDVTDTDRIKAVVDGGARSAVVVGGGFIGIEVAENLRRRGLAVTLVEAAGQLLGPLDPEMAAPVTAELRAHGVDVRLGARTVKVLPDAVELEDGGLVPGDLVLFAIGVRPDTALAENAGLAIGPRGGIAVDERQRTSDPFVYAVGDAAEKTDHLTGEPTLVPLANLANRHGRLAADAIAGRPVRSAPAIGTAVVGVFGLTAAATGWNEKRLIAAGRPHQVVHTHPVSHAGYYPGAERMALKLLLDPSDGTILGAQAVGGAGVDKRIDVLATAIRGGLTAADLADLELAYAPAYGSAKDPVNLLGHVADNLATGTTRTVQWHELDAALAAGAVLVDVRTPAEHAAGAIPGALNIPLDLLRDRLDELPSGRPLVVHCQVGQRGHTAARLLAQHGHQAANLDGGYLTWQAGTAGSA
ncbi:MULTISPECIES: FAD-dependent oxidoreductase [unclassified Streptomyces]|uniref:FAD-dependent oxidoreductase n=1 Tax=unclassified Streptomyces TaxID=2593676 RepID=UPI0016611789|nr:MULTISPECIES: FAD-dependent oxidoreductase [unclassified Streptomyces]MBD0709172.1 CoA-disulfide reductase [Streptomyces sp. CBMA291]MBD0714473.1 CoA-disulfide reductase [Streptomyces sp. CBMA370]